MTLHKGECNEVKEKEKGEISVTRRVEKGRVAETRVAVEQQRRTELR